MLYWRRWFGVMLAVMVVVLGLHAATTGFDTARAVGLQERQTAIQVIDQSYESKFREALIFRIHARSTAGKIVYARVFWRVRSFESITSHRLENFQASNEVELEYRYSTRFETTPPWQVIFYRWELTDEAGNVLRTPEQKAEYADDTRAWQQKSDGRVAVYWYDRDEEFGEKLLDVARESFDHVAEHTGFTPDDELRVVVYNSQEDFCTFYGPMGCVDWIGGQAFGSLTVGWLDEERDADEAPGCNAACRERRKATRIAWFFEELVPHELAHAFLNYWMGQRVQALPIWFNEGQAMNNELTGYDDKLIEARDLAARGELERLAFMEARTTITRNDVHAVGDWYIQAFSLVAFLYERWGDESLGEIILMVDKGKTFEVAMQTVTGMSLDEYELAWREWLGVMEIPPTFMPTPTLFMFPSPTYEPTPAKR